MYDEGAKMSAEREYTASRLDDRVSREKAAIEQVTSEIMLTTNILRDQFSFLVERLTPVLSQSLTSRDPQDTSSPPFGSSIHYMTLYEHLAELQAFVNRINSVKAQIEL
jgi:hypothetical protein